MENESCLKGTFDIKIGEVAGSPLVDVSDLLLLLIFMGPCRGIIIPVVYKQGNIVLALRA